MPRRVAAPLGVRSSPRSSSSIAPWVEDGPLRPLTLAAPTPPCSREVARGKLARQQPVPVTIPHTAIRRFRGNVRRSLAAVRRLLVGRCAGHVHVEPAVEAGLVEARGWAYLPRSAVASVIVTINGEIVGAARLGLPSPELTSVRGERAAVAGWRLTVDLSSRAGESIRVGALILFASGLVESLEDVIVDVRARPHASLSLIEEAPAEVVSPAVEHEAESAAVAPNVEFNEEPKVDAQPVEPPLAETLVIDHIDVRRYGLTGFMNVGGVIWLRRTPARLLIELDGAPAGLARLFDGYTPMPSPTACAATRMGRFMHAIDVRHCRPGTTVELRCRAVDLDGRIVESHPVSVRLDPPPVGAYGGGRQRSLPGVRAGNRDSGQLRLFVVAHHLGFGGAQHYLLELLKHLLADPTTSCVLVSPGDGPLRPVLEALGAEIHFCGSVPGHDLNLYEAAVVELALLAAHFRCNAAVVNCLDSGIGGDVCDRMGIPAVWAVHEHLDPEEWFHIWQENGTHPVVKERLLRAFAATAAPVFVCDATRELYEPYGNPSRMLTIRYGIDLGAVDRYREVHHRDLLRQTEGIALDATVLVSLATVETRKAQAATVLAMAELASLHQDLALVFVGDSPSPYSEALRQLIDEAGLGDRIRLIPLNGDPYRWLTLADAFVLASDLESLPRSIIEAMAFGLPVVASKVGGVREIVVDGETGLLCEPRDVQSLTMALHRLLRLPAPRRRTMGEAGRRQVMSQYGVDGYVRDIEALLRGLLADASARPQDLLEPRRAVTGGSVVAPHRRSSRSHTQALSRRFGALSRDVEIRSHLYHHSYVLPQAKILYVETPKVACTALKNWLVRATGVNVSPPAGWSPAGRDRGNLVHIREVVPIASLIDLTPDVLEEVLESDEWIRWCVTRNPYARVYSAWQGKILFGDPTLLGQFGPPGADEVCDSSGALDVGATFRRFAEDLHRRPSRYVRDMHFRPQHLVVLHQHIAYTDVVDLGGVDAFIERLRCRVRESGLADPGGLLRMNEGLGFPWAAAYDEASSEVVLNTYREDFARLGYPTTLPASEPGQMLSLRESALLRAVRNREHWLLTERANRERDKVRLDGLERSLRTTLSLRGTN